MTYKHPERINAVEELEYIKVRNAEAMNEIFRICEAGARGAWRMSIPVDKTDSDILVSESLLDIPHLIAAIEQLQAELKLLQADMGFIKSEAKRGAAYVLSGKSYPDVVSMYFHDIIRKVDRTPKKEDVIEIETKCGWCGHEMVEDGFGDAYCPVCTD